MKPKIRLFLFAFFAAATTIAVARLSHSEFTTAGAAHAATPEAFGEEFWKTWGDGQAELCGYELLFTRYGQERRGTAVTVFTTETFSKESRVKADQGKHDAKDVFPVMKLNVIQDFQTGIYDYNLMTSVFLAIGEGGGVPAGTPTKISFSAQEWCGQVYEQSLFDAKEIRVTSHSYFDGEADREAKLERKDGGVAEETLLLWARGFAAPYLTPGELKQVPFLFSAQTSRLQHLPSTWTLATLSRGAKTQVVVVPGGSFECERYGAEIQGPGGEHLWTIYVESAAPHRIVRWDAPQGVRGELLAGERMKYWEMNSNLFHDAVKKLGLEPRPPHTM